MKIKARNNACQNSEGDDHPCFDVLEYCCPKAKKEIEPFAGYGLYRYLNDDDSISWGEFGEYLVDDVKFCPWCGKPVETEKDLES